MEQARQDALERWNVGRWQEWTAQSADEVFEALMAQARDNGWTPEGGAYESFVAQTRADADVIWEWLEHERGG